MPSLLPIGGTIRLNPSAGGAATVVPLAEGGFAAVYRIANGPDVFTLYDDNFQQLTPETTITSDDFFAPQAAALNDGQFVVAWLDNEQDIEANIYNSDGSLAVGPVTLATPTDPTVGLSAPRIVGNAFGGFTAIWQDNATIDGVTGSVFIQSYDGNGDPVGDPITVSPPLADPSEQVSINDFRIAVLGDGTTVVAAQVQIDGIDSIMYSVNGGALTSLAGGDPNYIYTNPQITPLAAGGYVITYDFVNPNLVGSDSPDANWTTGGSVFTSHGTRHDFAIGTTVTTTQNGTFAVDPSVITPLADGGFVVTFEPLTSPLGDGYLVDAQQFDGFGNAVGPVVLVAPQGFLPSVATSANGVVLDTYQFGTGLFLQAFNSAPTPLGPEPDNTSFGLNSVVSANSPGVAPLTTGGFVVAYQDQNQNAWAQIYDYNREPVGSPFEVSANATQPVVASQTNGTFLVAWSTGTQIMGTLYDNQGDVLIGPFDMSGAPSTLPVLDPAINALPDGGYSMAYETDLQDTSGSHLVTIQQFDQYGQPVGSPVSQSFAPTNPLAPPKIAALEAELFGSVTVIGVGDAIVAAIVSAPLSGGGGAGITGQNLVAVSHAGIAPTTTTIQVSGANDGARRDGAQVISLNDGNIVVVWDEAGASAETWSIVGEVMTPAGVAVGNTISITTALPSNSPAGQIALAGLPDGGFLVTYDAGNSSLASQRFDPAGNEIDGPVLMSGNGQTGAVTTVLSNGTLLLLSGSSPTGGGTITGAAFSVPAIPMNWTGATSTNLATGGNWDIMSAPDSGHAMQFSLANGGTLTGTATAGSAAFSGQGPWVLSAASVSLTQGMSEQSTLSVAGGSLTGGAAAVISATGGASVSVSGGAQVSFQSTDIGAGSGQTGTLTLSGTGTDWTDTGTNGSGGLQAGSSAGPQTAKGVINVSQSAHLTGSDTDVLGVTAASEGDLSIATGGTVSDAGMVIGASGTGVAGVTGGLLTSTGSLDIGQLAGGQGTLTVNGSGAAVSVSGTVTVGDAGMGGLAIQSAGSVGALSGLVIANQSGASGASASVSGNGSKLTVAGLLDVGAAGSGSLQLSAGATVTAGSFDTGSAAGGSGAISVTGANTDLAVTGTATVGDQSSATLSVLSGGTFSASFLEIGPNANTGAVVLGGATSTLQVTNDVTVGHNGVLSVGAGETIHIGGNFEVDGALTQGDNSVIDPTTTLNNTRTGLGGGSSNVSTTRIDNNSTYYVGEDKNGSYTFNTPLFTAQPSHSGVLELGTATNTGAEGDLVLNAGTVDATQKVQFTGPGAILTLGSYAGASAPLIDNFAATINGFAAGDTIVVDTTAAASFALNGSVVSIVDNVGGAVEGTIAFADATAASTAFNTAGALVDPMQCYAAGTMISTTRGLVPVESIHPGDRVCTVLGGDTAEVIWVGRRKVDCARHPKPVKVWPVRVTAHAFGRGMPSTDLILSPDHAVYVDEVLIPIRLLINGRTVRQELTERITYHHIELAEHDVLLANGMPAESYLDTGDRARFSNGGPVVTLHPDFSARVWETRGCAPLVQAGPKLTAVRRRLATDVARRRRVRETYAPGNIGPR